MRTPIGNACANGEQGTRVRKCSEGDCGRRRQQKCTLLRGTIVGLLEPERLVQVRKAGAIGSARGSRGGAPLPVGEPEGPLVIGVSMATVRGRGLLEAGPGPLGSDG